MFVGFYFFIVVFLDFYRVLFFLLKIIDCVYFMCVISFVWMVLLFRVDLKMDDLNFYLWDFLLWVCKDVNDGNCYIFRWWFMKEKVG